MDIVDAVTQELTRTAQKPGSTDIVSIEGDNRKFTCKLSASTDLFWLAKAEFIAMLLANTPSGSANC